MRDVVKIATFLSIEGCLRDCGRKRRQHSGESRRTENIWLQVEDENEREGALGGQRCWGTAFAPTVKIRMHSSM